MKFLKERRAAKQQTRNYTVTRGVLTFVVLITGKQNNFDIVT